MLRHGTSHRDLLRRRRRDPRHQDRKLPPLPVRSECRSGPRPCPHVRCRYHLMLEVSRAGALQLAEEDGDVAVMGASCALDLAEHGGMTLEQVGDVLRLTRERVRQLEEEALAKVSDYLLAGGLTPAEIRQAVGQALQGLAQPPPQPVETQDRPPSGLCGTDVRKALGLNKKDAPWLSDSLREWMSTSDGP